MNGNAVMASLLVSCEDYLSLSLSFSLSLSLFPSLPLSPSLSLPLPLFLSLSRSLSNTINSRGGLKTVIFNRD